jgi:nucleoside phosphorylase
MPPLALDQYHVGVICALSTKMAASRAMLDDEHGLIKEKDIQHHNVYFAGRMRDHNVVIAWLPAGVDGLAAAAIVAKVFEHIRFGMLIGIGGGIPDVEGDADVRLGDVIVCRPSGAARPEVLEFHRHFSSTPGRHKGHEGTGYPISLD